MLSSNNSHANAHPVGSMSHDAVNTLPHTHWRPAISTTTDIKCCTGFGSLHAYALRTEDGRDGHDRHDTLGLKDRVHSSTTIPLSPPSTQIVQSFSHTCRGKSVCKVPTSLATSRCVRALGAARLVRCCPSRHDNRDRLGWLRVRAVANTASCVEPHNVRDCKMCWHWLAEIDGKLQHRTQTHNYI